MTDTTQPPVHRLVVEIVRAGLILGDLVGDLLEGLPDDAFPGKDPAEVLLEMIAGSARPAAEAIGDRAVSDAIALVGAIVDRTIDDLRAAAALAHPLDDDLPPGSRRG